MPLRLLADPKIRRLFAALAATGGETRIVGGAVRDSLMGRRPHEVDLATTALPEAVMAAAAAAGLKCAPTGIEHGTVTIVVEGTPFEVTTLREDVETFGRHAKVRFGDDFEADALRRDFTINALSLSEDGALHDYTGGLADLEARHIRFIGDPATRIAEDHLRVLRFFRFHASFGAGALDPAGLHAAILARHSLQKLSAERLRAETLKLLAARGAVAVAREVSQAGILEIVVGATFPARLERLAAIEDALGRFVDPLLRLIALCVIVEEDADRLRERLRLSNIEHKRAASAARLLAKLHGAETAPSELDLTRLLFVEGRDAARDALALAHAENRAPVDDDGFLRAARFLAEAPAPDFPVKAADLMARGLLPGRALGAVLKELQAKWIRAGFPKDPAIVTRLVEEATTSRD
ncbi:MULTISPECIES: CCA tRNA nucleotidyltransferase [Methylosinus]|uniref:CCA tRNA nucleotidyltransferase n=1 Tax=Methylosinus trichosporium (strain ATCC 35070 / NCIMB 11131 / UNIQEM 75 / OB3b) TaxID=595536 RepID=A0A2D2D524_METT3|nr:MULTISPECIES: CCA tRNA nucleotidyltransferase [Methylosinus]ATQ70065.1 CCA tRNA nucleotidyltransferase [Methylosinus trichosporium OB3b]OBS54417.1 polynucleotide adenylyltransferase [Methylosinus sp. 3S-1]